MRKSILVAIVIACVSFGLGFWAANEDSGDRVGIVSARFASTDADSDFAREMLESSQLAIAAAKTVIENGRNPELRARAHELIKARESDSAWYYAWLGKNAAQKETPAK